MPDGEYLKLRRVDPKRIDEDSVKLKTIYPRSYTGTGVLRRLHMDETQLPESLRERRPRTNSGSFKTKRP